MTESSNFAPCRYQEVADAEVEASKLGLAARNNYRPTTEDAEKP
jgi:hypothetical protein